MKRSTQARTTPNVRSAKPPAAAPSSTNPQFLAPYPPSAFDRLTAWVDRLPIPPWLAYALMALVPVTLAAALRVTGAVDRGGDYTDFLTAIQPSLAFCFMHYIDRMAGAALDATRSLLHNPDDDTQVLRYRLTTLPASSVRWAIVVGAGLSLLLIWGSNEFLVAGSLTPFARGVVTVVGGINVTLFPIFVVHSFHQLWVINDLLTRRVRVDLFRIRPLYAFSNVTAVTAVTCILFGAGWFLLSQPTGVGVGVQIIWTAFDAVLAAIIFLSPLWGVHRVLVQRKGEALAEIAQRKQAAYANFHLLLDQRRTPALDTGHKALVVLEMEVADVNRIPTWPWSPGTPRGLLAAVLLPITIWLIQFGLGRMLQ
jgi:hypothetical protein